MEVAPLAGAWIETSMAASAAKSAPSRPSRARGLKLGQTLTTQEGASVAPLAGAWIETFGSLVMDSPNVVAPLAGAWIET